MHGRSRCLPVAGDCLAHILRENGIISRSRDRSANWTPIHQPSALKLPAIHPQTSVPGGEGPAGPSPAPLPKPYGFLISGTPIRDHAIEGGTCTPCRFSPHGV